MKEDELGGTCNTHGEMRKAYEIWVGKPERKSPHEGWGIDERILLEWILKKQGVGWINVAQNRDQWRAFMKTVANLRVPQKAGNFLAMNTSPVS
jgi:hypothetical protein